MSKERDMAIDDLFKRTLEDPVDKISYSEFDWDALEDMLDSRDSRKSIIAWLPHFSAAAAIILVFFGLFKYTHRQNTSGHNQLTIKTTKVNDGPKNSDEHTEELELPVKTQSGEKIYALKQSNPAVKSSSVNTYSATNNEIPVLSTTTLSSRAQSVILSAVSETVKIDNAEMNQQISLAETVKSATLKPARVSQAVISKAKTGAFRPRYALSVLAAPDANGVGSFQESRTGVNLGVLFSAKVYKKFTISTGALYSIKPYAAAYEKYNLPIELKTDPTSISSDCRMLDIPLNLGYQVYNKGQNRIIVGTGLSSYIMLHESYTYNFAAPAATAQSGYSSTATEPSGFTVPKSGKYFFGVYNMNVSYEHQLTSKMGITVQPYLKLPISSVGWGQVRLQTTGVALGVNWNIN